MMTWTRTLRRVIGLGAPKTADTDVQRAAATARRQAVERPYVVALKLSELVERRVRA